MPCLFEDDDSIFAFYTPLTLITTASPTVPRTHAP